MLNLAVRYFYLETPVLGGPGVKTQLFLYTGVAAGTVAKWIFDLLSGASLGLTPLFLGLIASIVIFPAIYKNGGLNKSKADFVKWCVAFQNGFFWVALLGSVAKTFAHLSS